MQNSEYSRNSKFNTAMSIYVNGSEAVEFEEVPQRKVRRTETEQERQKRRKKQSAVKRKQVVRKKYAAAKEREQQKQRTEMSKVKMAQQQRQAETKRKLITGAVCVACAALFIISCVSLITNSSENARLTNEISELEASYDELKTQNDSKEYDIDNFVDLNAVKRIATEELGMVRSSADQIVYYEANDDEYIQQVAEVQK